MTSNPADEATSRKYDETPYPSMPYPQTHPNHLAVIGMLFGMQPPELANRRVLELGCADTGNLIPMAANLPEVEFVGVDTSARHITDGQELVDQLGLTNIRLLHQSILDTEKQRYGCAGKPALATATIATSAIGRDIRFLK